MMDDIQKAVLETFHSETQEILTELESALLELEANPEEQELVDRVFRALHTIKGNAAMFGFDAISRFTHDLENVYDLVRAGKLRIEKKIIDLTLAARDVIAEMIKDPDMEDTVQRYHTEGILDSLKKYLPADVKAKTARTDEPISREQSIRTYRIKFTPAPDIFFTGTNPLLLLRELREIGSATIIPNLKDLPVLGELDPERCFFSWNIILSTRKSINAIRDVFIFVEDRCVLEIDLIDEDGDLDNGEEHLRLGDILIERGDLSKEELEKVLNLKAPLGRELVDRNLVDRETVESALLEQEIVRNARSRRRDEEVANSVRVASEKLDNLVNLVGELVTMQARLSRSAEQINNPELSAISETMELLTSGLRDSAFSIRMLPIGSTFSSFRRTLRDLAAEVGREIELITEGGETELDKTVIDKLRDPLVHLIRNAVDHGIESPEKRESAGKPRAGTILLSASQAGADVMIKVSDDGAGMNPVKIREKALAMGLINDHSHVDEKELLSLVFEPAFSTADSVTSVSGRGVGMDVVKRHVESLRGTIEIESNPGRGTDVYIRLPLTLAIIDGLQVGVGAERYVLPLSNVEECVELDQLSDGRARKRHTIEVRGTIIPFLSLRELFGINGQKPEREMIVLTRTADERIGFVVDTVIGEHQTVIKPLGKVYRNVEGISGATVLGDGCIALILDLVKLSKIHGFIMKGH